MRRRKKFRALTEQNCDFGPSIKFNVAKTPDAGRNRQDNNKVCQLKSECDATLAFVRTFFLLPIWEKVFIPSIQTKKERAEPFNQSHKNWFLDLIVHQLKKQGMCIQTGKTIERIQPQTPLLTLRLWLPAAFWYRSGRKKSVNFRHVFQIKKHFHAPLQACAGKRTDVEDKTQKAENTPHGC